MRESADPLAYARRHGELLERQLPGQVVGIYLVGSVALGDYSPGRSDIDTVTVLRRELNNLDDESLVHVHDALSVWAGENAPAYDTTYVPVSWLAKAPDPDAVTPFSLDGRLRLGESAPQLVPPTWLELTRSVPVLGPDPEELDVFLDDVGLRSWTVGNLRGYWAKTAAEARAAVHSRPVDAPARGDGVTWLVLGAPRLHATLATGEVVSKSTAGEYAAQQWPHFAELARRCVDWRHGRDVRFMTTDALAAADLVDKIVASATSSAWTATLCRPGSNF
jgi:predicted nucleotidyltransferase